MPQALAFHRACVDADFRDDPDQNHPESTGVSPRARNTIDGVRISMAIAYLDPARHRLNLTIKGNVTVRRLLFDGKRAVGVEVESGGERFTVEGGQIVLSGGAIGSPHVLLLSGVGPRAQLQSVGVPVVHELPGVGQNLRDHPSAAVLYRAKGAKPDVQAPSIQVGLRYTVEGSYLQNDMQMSPMLMTSEHRPIHVPISDDDNYITDGVSL
jgi:choline dehydrogenase-like flavoprotein